MGCTERIAQIQVNWKRSPKSIDRDFGQRIDLPLTMIPETKESFINAQEGIRSTHTIEAVIDGGRLRLTHSAGHPRSAVERWNNSWL